MLEDLKPDNPTNRPPETGGQPAAESGEPSAADQSATPGPEAAPEAAAESAWNSDTSDESELAGAGDWEAAELADWKAGLRRDFEEWLAGLDTLPEAEELEGAAEASPDLYSFYEELAAANVEARKSNRRTAEAMSQWGDVLGRFESGLAPLRETVAQLAAAQPKAGRLSRAHSLVLVELQDRLRRIERAFASSPARKRWWGGGSADWSKVWEAQRQAFGIVVGHLEGLLKKEGVTRFETLGELFDPTRMTAVAVEPDASRPAQTVIEEIAPGYLRDGELLRAAQVKVTRRP